MTSFTLRNNAPYLIKAFRATENKVASKQFVKAHTEELKKIGVTKVASCTPEWINDPNVIVFCLMDVQTNRPVAGMKIDIWNETKTLPIIRSLAGVSSDILGIVRDHSYEGIAEICGLWVSDQVNGLGISKILIRAAISVFPSLGIKKSIAFASQYTIKTISCMGFEIFSEIGDNGKFLYPTKDFESYVALLHDAKNVGGSEQREQKLILGLQKNPQLMRLENEKEKSILIQYDLTIKKRLRQLVMA